MKKCWIWLMTAVLLAGCAAQPDYETVSDGVRTDLPEARKVSITMPEDAASPVSSQSDGALYLCDGYSVTVQTLPGGDFDRTIRTVTGFSKDNLQIFEQTRGDCKRFDCAWSCVGETGDTVCRGVILDDGYYHYVLTVQMDAARSGELTDQVNALCASFDVA